jgi:heat shock protein HslJ
MSIEGAFRRSWGSLALISLVLVACADTGDGTGTGTGTDPDDLVGVVWVLDDASIARLVDEAPTGAQVTLTFEEGQVHGTAACNSYGGSYDAGDDGSLSFEGFAVTEMACEPPLMTLESAYLEVLGGVTGFEVDATLRLTNGGATLSFSREVPPEPLPLERTAWTLSSVYSGDAVTSVMSGTEVTALFGDDGSVSGSGGCNRFSGTYMVDGDALSLSPLASTKMACADHVMAEERVFLDGMGRVASFTIDGAQLTLLDGSEAPLLGFDGVTG